MGTFQFPLLLLSLLLLDHTTANVHRTKALLKSNPIISQSQHQQEHDTTNNGTTKPSVYFEVTKPIKHPKSKPCSHLILNHDFGYTYGKPPVLANYTPPLHCPSKEFSTIVLKWRATCKGRQYDRIFGVWLGGVELLRSCTAEPRATGILWTVEKDITRFYNYGDENIGNLASYHGNKADLIIPLSRNLPLNDGLWFEIENSNSTEVKEFKIPQNVYRAVLEVYVSFHENDEFWYGNLPNDYIAANNLTDVAGNGPFREVLVSVDGKVVGAFSPFTVIYTGGINPLLWRPITGIGSFDLPSYDIELTPLLGTMLDGMTHQIGFSITNALNVWYIDANLHLWLDDKSNKTEGMLLKHISLPLVYSLESEFKGLNGRFLVKASRSISSSGWVKSSHGNITTHFLQGFNYRNTMVIGNEGNLQIIDQIIHFTDSVSALLSSSSPHLGKSLKKFTLYLYSDYLDQGNDTSLSVANLTLGFNENNSKSAAIGSLASFLNNTQNGQGVIVVKNNLVVSGVGSTQQVYKFNGSRFCYFRNISSSNYTILYDKVGNKCNKSKFDLGFRLSYSLPLTARRTFLASDLHNI
ncbi:PNGaseA domain-containing protein [Cephalotus follicularis]|uniref:PNGaseA domain-containing protein n=1 Tax=Cephalotus follicularis TaxID=3775 RepID=A0A1Q3AYC5_CEPFO|nr:PNGaseA domain-containing protein [Cephalotus follicularis]